MTANLTESINDREDVAPRRPLPDRRARHRLPLALEVRIEPRCGARGPIAAHSAIAGRTRDISSRGAYVWCGERFDKGQSLQLTLEVPPDRGRNWTLEIQCEAEVVRVEPANPRHEGTGIAVRILRFKIPQVPAPLEVVPD